MTKDEAIAFLETLESTDEIKDPVKLLEALKNANDEAKSNREQLAEANQKLEGYDKFKQTAKQVAISRELKAAGIKNPDKVVRLMNAESIELSETGELTGFTEQLETTKSDWPELFDAKRQAGSVDQFSGKQDPEPKLSATQLQLKQLRDAAGV